MNISDVLKVHQTGRPAHPAIESGDTVVTYGALAMRVDDCAAKLRKRGVKTGHVVGMELPDGIEHLVVLYGLAKIGAIVFPLAGGSPQPEKKRLLEFAGAKHFIAAQGPSPVESAVLLVAAEICDVRDGNARASREQVSTKRFSADSPLLIISSSGTSGAAKFMQLTHAQIHWRITTRERDIGFSPADRYLSIIQLSFNLGRIRCMRAIQNGATIVFPRLQEKESLVDCMRRKGITITNMLPTQVRNLFSAMKSPGPAMKDLRLVIGSSPISAEGRLRIRRRVTPQLYEVYAATEVGPVAVASPADQDARPGSVGRLVDEVEAQVVGDDGRPLAAGAAGQIRFRAPNLPVSYLKNPQATAAAFRDGWFYPGDLAAIDGDGYIFLKGRNDDVINNEGAKFYPAEVESALTAHPAVVEAAVLGWPHPKVGEAALACVVVKSKVSSKALKEFCRQKIAAHKVPFVILFLGSLPKNPAGKVLKRELREKIRRRQRAAAGSEQPGTVSIARGGPRRKEKRSLQ